MLALAEGSQRLGSPVRDSSRKPMDTVENMMMSVQKTCRQALIQNVCRGRDFPWTTTTRAATLPHDFYSEVYCDDEWSGLIKCLRIADDTVHRLRYTNKYVEQQIGRFLRETEEVKILSDLSAGVLDEMSQLDIELNRAVFMEMTRMALQDETRKTSKIVTFANVPRKCKSAEYSVRGVCSTCAVRLKDGSSRRAESSSRRLKVKRKKDYGTYCSECGVIEVPSQSSAIRCRDCDGEIIIQSLCSSCDKLEPGRSRLLVDTACSTCDLSRKKRAPSDDLCKTCNRKKANPTPRKEVVYHVKHSQVPKFVEYPEESSCCSDCDGSSSVSDPKTNWVGRKTSAESVAPGSESDQVVGDVRNYRNICDESSSLSSSATESVRLACNPVTPDRALQSEQATQQTESTSEELNSAEEDSFDTPRESLSLENVEASPPVETKPAATDETSPAAEESPAAPEPTSDEDEEEAAEPVGDYKTAEEFVDSERETSDVFEEASEEPARNEDALTSITDRIEKAEAAISDLSEGNALIEEDVNDMEMDSKENAKLSTILREIVLGMVTHANLVEYQVNYPLFSLQIIPTVPEMKPAAITQEAEEDSDVEDYEEAVEGFPTIAPADSEAETYYDVPPPSYYYICLECGIGTSYQPLGLCTTCGGSLTEIPNGILDWKTEASADPVKSPESMQMAKTEKEMPLVRIKADLLSELPLAPLENRLKSIERDADLLKRNNGIVNSIIDNFQEKIKDDIRNVRLVSSEWSEDEVIRRTIVGYDLSIYQVRRLVTERRSRVNTETVEEVSEEIREDKRTFIEMKFEEVFKKEQQRALELEIFEQKLEVEGLIIKEKEDYFTCSNSNEAIATEVMEETREAHRQIPTTLSRRITSEKFRAASKNDFGKKDDLTISIEIEVEKESKGQEKKAIRCEYKANLQKNVFRDQSYTRSTDLGRTLPTITLYPMWSRTNRRSINFGADYEDSSLRGGCSAYSRYSSGELLTSTESGYLNADGDEDFVEIKSPKYFRGSSDEESDICAGDTDRRRRRCHSIAAVQLPIAMYPVTEIRLAETPLAVVNTQKQICCQMREFSRISQIELEQCPRSGVVLLQRAAVSSLGVLERSGKSNDLPEDTSFEEFYEVRSQHVTSDTSIQRTGDPNWSNCSGESLQWNAATKNTRRMVRFTPVYVDGTSVVSITLPDESLPVLTLEDRSMCGGIILETQSSERFDVVGSTCSFPPDDELHKALTLIHEIENDVVEVKLHSAIAILPQLESILREHLQDKMKLLRKKSSSATVSTHQTSSLEVFMSTLNFLTEVKSEVELVPSHETVAFSRAESDERLRRMLNLLTGLEEAVKQINTDDERKPSTPACDAEPNADRICQLLRVLSNRIKETASAEPDVAEIEKTLDIAAELDVAVRNYSEEIKVGLKSMESSDAFEEPESLESPRASDGFVDTEKLSEMKKKLFGMVASEAEERDARLERDFDRLERLEHENAETMKFLDTLLDKTLRRVAELDEIRQGIFGLRGIIEDISSLVEAENKRSEATMTTATGESEASLPRIGRTPTLPSIKEVSSDKTGESSEEDDEDIRKTLSGMIVELDNLKSKAAEKKERVRKIFGEGGRSYPEPLPIPEKAVTCLKTEQCDGPRSCITQINKLGTSTYYLTWTKPVINDEECIVTGYEIWVNGKVNQRVRNPERLKAVLYSVNSILPGDRLRIKLYALTGDGRRLSLTDLKYPDGG